MVSGIEKETGREASLTEIQAVEQQDALSINSRSANFLDFPTEGAWEDAPPISPFSPSRFLNRELSWLGFNKRVLLEANDPRHPLLERLRFLSISGSNLDEFYSVRIAGLRELVNKGVSRAGIDSLPPVEQLQQIDVACRKLMKEQDLRWRDLRRKLAHEDIHIVGPRHLSRQDREWLSERFMRDVFPVLSPLAIDPAHPFPFIPTKSLSLALQLKQRGGEGKIDALLLIPGQLPRFMRLEEKTGSSRIRFIALEDVIGLSLDLIFPGYDVLGAGLFRILRDSDIEIEDEAEDLVREFEIALRRRRRGDVIRLQVSANMSVGLKNWIMRELNVEPSQAVEVPGIIGIADLVQLIVADRPKLIFAPNPIRRPERLVDFENDCFAAIRHKDILLHHPYETFDVVVQFLQQAARDPNVLSIKQTLYRTSEDSPIVQALCDAAEMGKQVTALVELKARFDEAANIAQARVLERAGAQVVYGFMDWKTHAKMSSVARREGDRVVTYTHYGTGNYHPLTAKLYTDLSYFTADPALGRDAARVFNFVTGYAQPRDLERVSVAPLALKSTLIRFLEEEAEHARAGRPAQVWAKMNSVNEPQLVDALYRASQAGVKIDLVIRGICGLRPGVPGLSDNIRVKSVIGRYLEHSRIFCFGAGHGLPSKGAKVFLSSADWMDRNLNRRVETLVPIDNPTVKSQIVDQVMSANMRDETNTWIIRWDGGFQRGEISEGRGSFDCHRFFMENPSLSGRGRAGTRDVRFVKDRG